MLDNQPLVSVIMPAYNCERFIRQSLESILNQTYLNWELLIADDASKDKTKKIIDNYSDPRIKKFHNSTNLGYLKTCNKLLELSEGEFIAFQDADDYSDLKRIELQINFLLENKEYALCGTNLTQIDDSNNLLFCTNYPKDNDEIVENIKTGYFSVMPNSFVFRQEIYTIVGGYNEFFDRIGVEDYYWTWLILQQFKMKNLPLAGYYYRFNLNSVTGNISNDPSKINIIYILNDLIKQQIETGTDDLQENRQDLLNKKLDKLNKPFIDDPSYFYYYVAKRRFYEGHKKQAILLMRKAIATSPFKLNYYKDLLYFLRN
jgi:glycosyltransferase involved in cell wall biosynthesis